MAAGQGQIQFVLSHARKHCCYKCSVTSSGVFRNIERGPQGSRVCGTEVGSIRGEARAGGLGNEVPQKLEHF
jgi:hypothetical protein